MTKKRTFRLVQWRRVENRTSWRSQREPVPTRKVLVNYFRQPRVTACFSPRCLHGDLNQLSMALNLEKGKEFRAEGGRKGQEYEVAGKGASSIHL